MGNNNEIRKRMEICRKVLLAIVWIIAVVGVIGGVKMMDERYLKPFGIIVIIMSILEGFLGHFLVNVVLSIPFILLNNGDYLAAIAGTPSEKISSGGSTNNKGANEKKALPASEKDVYEYTVITNTPLRSAPEESAYPVTSLKAGDKVYFQYIDKNSSYYNVNTSDSQNGWCLASHLEKT